MINEIRILHCDIELIQKELEANKPYEACGIMIGTINGNMVYVEKVLPIKNVKHTRTSFELDSKQFYDAWNNADETGKEIVGVYHTHPVSSAVPSLWDRETMKNVTLVWLIAGADGIRAYMWDKGVKAIKIIELENQMKNQDEK